MKVWFRRISHGYPPIYKAVSPEQSVAIIDDGCEQDNVWQLDHVTDHQWGPSPLPAFWCVAGRTLYLRTASGSTIWSCPVRPHSRFPECTFRFERACNCRDGCIECQGPDLEDFR